MRANRRESGAPSSLTSDLQPPQAGPNADPVLYGVAAALASLFPPVVPQPPNDAGAGSEADAGEFGGST